MKEQQSSLYVYKIWVIPVTTSVFISPPSRILVPDSSARQEESLILLGREICAVQEISERLSRSTFIMTEELSRLRKKRSANKNALQRLIKKAEDITHGELDERKLNEIRVHLEAIEGKEKIVADLNEKIIDIVEEDKIDEDVEEATLFEITVRRSVAGLIHFLEKPPIETKPIAKSEGSIAETKKGSLVSGVKLPKIHIKKFAGEPTEWQQFFDTFKATVDDNRTLSNIEKFTYLKGYLAGAAERCIEGMTLSDDNYVKALSLLEERYGNKQIIVASHVNKILRLEKVKGGRNVTELRGLYDQVESHVRSLGTLDVQSENYGPVLIPIILERLPDDIKLHISRVLGNDSWKMDDFMRILKEEIAARENCNFMKSQVSGEEKAKWHVMTEALMTGTRPLICAFCSKEHYHDKCPIVTDPEKRKEIVRKERLCYKCLFKNHNIRKCRSKRNCFHCKSSSHHTAICSRVSKNENTEEGEAPKHTANLVGSKTTVLLQTACGLVSDTREKRSVPVKIVMDSGAERTYITERLVKRLKLDPNKSQNVMLNTFGSAEGKVATLNFYSFCVKNPKRGCTLYMTGFAVPVICAPLTSYKIEIVEDTFPELKNLDLSDERMDNQEIDLLIGCDYYWSIVGDENIRCGKEGLVAVNSKLGWLLSGPMKEEKEEAFSANLATHTMKVSFNENIDETRSLHAEVEKLWDLETLGIKDNEKSVYDKFMEDVKFVDGRYEVQFPFKEERPLIADNYTLALKRLMTLKNKLDESPKLLEQYDGIIQNQLKMGIVERALDDAIPGEVTYLPHRCVIRDDKETTKIRIVFDASAKSKGPSLNECLYKGPSLNPLLLNILLKFRVPNIGVCADIEAAYLQISIFPGQRDYARFLWFDNVEKCNPEVIKLRFTRVFFGSSPSQFLLNAVLRVHLNKYKNVDPAFVDLLLGHLYVDDLNCGVATVTEGMELYQKAKARFKEGNFNIRKWKTNNAVLQQMFDSKENVREVPKEGKVKLYKVLGILWNEKDEFVLNVKSYVSGIKTRAATKRNILKTVAGIFDSAGYILPLTVKMRMVFQSVWEAGLGWDERLSEDLNIKWNNVVNVFRNTEDVVISRCYCLNSAENPIVRTELHGFSDASEQCYAACVYFKFLKSNGDVQVSLVAAKSRLVPNKNKLSEDKKRKKFTIPRLELLGNFILSKLMVNIIAAIQDEICINEIFCWSDSTISLAWIKATEKEFQTFVQNRVTAIRKNIDKENWYHCSSEENAADVLTRDREVNLSEWLHGPQLIYDLNLDARKYVCVNRALQCPEFHDEVKQIKSTLHITQESNESVGNVIRIEQYSDVMKLFRVTAFVLRFIRNLKALLKKDALTLNKYAISK